MATGPDGFRLTVFEIAFGDGEAGWRLTQHLQAPRCQLRRAPAQVDRCHLAVGSRPPQNPRLAADDSEDTRLRQTRDLVPWQAKAEGEYAVEPDSIAGWRRDEDLQALCRRPRRYQHLPCDLRLGRSLAMPHTDAKKPGMVPCKARIVAHIGVERVRRQRADGCPFVNGMVPGLVARQASIDQPDVDQFFLRVDAELAAARKCPGLFAA